MDDRKSPIDNFKIKIKGKDKSGSASIMVSEKNFLETTEPPTDRPQTHMGFSPHLASKRKNLAISPRNISLHIDEDLSLSESRTATIPTKAPDYEKPSSSYRSKRIKVKNNPNLNNREAVDQKVIDTKSLNYQDIKEKSIVKFNINAESSLLKKSSIVSNNDQKQSILENHAPMPNSLSSRLKVSILKNTHASEHKKDKKLTNQHFGAQGIQLSENLKGFSTPKFPNEVHNPHSKQSSEASVPEQKGSQLTKSNKLPFLRPSLRVVDYTEEVLGSIASTLFDEMDFESAIDYLFDSRNPNCHNAEFLHVTSRYNIDKKILKPNYYDLVILERPGKPSSGNVWTRFSDKKTSFVLPKEKIMQLSLHGVLSVDELGHNSELIEIDQFYYEKNQHDFLQTGRFFCYFKEIKVFSAWKSFTRSSRYKKKKLLLENNTFFSDHELVQAVLRISEVDYEIQNQIELFCFHGSGILCIPEYCDLQKKKFEECRKVLCDKIKALETFIAQQFDAFINGERLQQRLVEIQEHHPLQDKMSQADFENWTQNRSLKRLKDAFAEKIRNIFILGECKIQVALAVVIEKFWYRFNQFFLGIYTTRKSLTHKENFYWDIDHSLFDRLGQISESTLSRFNIRRQSMLGNEGSDPSASSSEQYPQSSIRQEIEDPHHYIQEGEEAEDKEIQIFSSSSMFQAISNAMSRVNDKGFRISQEEEQQGSHVCIEVNLFYNKKIVDIEDFFSLKIDRLKVGIVPGKHEIMDQVHSVCGHIGNLLESLPNLKDHPLALNDFEKFDRKKREKVDVDLDLGDMQSVHSSNYFTFLIMFPTFNSRNGYNLAIQTIRFVSQAYYEASGLDSYLFKLFEIARRIWAIHPQQIVKQLERSVIVPKLKEYIQNADSVDDMKRFMLKEKGKFSVFQSASDFLKSVYYLIQSFENIKHKRGVVSSFRPIIQQVHYFRSIQIQLLYERLPHSFSTRSSVLYDFMRRLEESFVISGNGLNYFVELMIRIKNFDDSREIFEVEFDICRSIYDLIVSFDAMLNETDLIYQDYQIKNLLKAKSSYRGKDPDINPEKLIKLCLDMHDMLNSTINKTKTVILGKLSELKILCLSLRQGLHQKIASTKEELASYDLVSMDKSVTEVSNFLNSIGKKVDTIRHEVDDSLKAQFTLLIAHDIIGAAEQVLSQTDIDKFLDMDQLEYFYENRCSAWNSISETSALKRQLLMSKLINNQVIGLSSAFIALENEYQTLLLREDNESILDQLKTLIDDIRPKVQIISFLSSKTMKGRHWKELSKSVFKKCGLILKFTGRSSEFISVLDANSKGSISLGTITKLVASEFFQRGAEKHIEEIKKVCSEAVIESFLETTLDKIETNLKNTSTAVSGEWLKDPRLREKIYLELNKITNLMLLKTILKYCIKTLIIVDSTSKDMSLNTFDTKIEKINFITRKIDKFITNYPAIQDTWFYVLPFTKFSPRGEIDRESISFFNSCTDELKKNEIIFQQKAGNLHTAFTTSAEHELNTDILRNNLNTILDDVHRYVQNILEVTPRLSFLSYNVLVSLLKSWLMGPQNDLEFISKCVHEMFKGVGKLKTSFNPTQRVVYCYGFKSYDQHEVFHFEHPISLSLPIHEFFKTFEQEIRLMIEKTCDSLVLHRINCFKALLADASIPKILENISSLFSQRLSHLMSMFNDKIPNESFYHINYISFAEDIWLCLGHPTGSMALARPDLIHENFVFSKEWKLSLNVLKTDCLDNIKSLYEHLNENTAFKNLSAIKGKSLLTSLLMQEVYFLHTVEDLLKCKCLESIIELWAGRYQLRFQFNHSDRFNHSPIEISLGSVTIPHGLEYFGSDINFVPSRASELVIQSVVSSAISCHGSVFINFNQDENSCFEVPGEYQVTPRDVASALGRLSLTLSFVSNVASARLFLSKLVYLDAIGSIDFMNISPQGLQYLSSALNDIWTAIESKNDAIFQESFTFPLKKKLSRNEVHNDRSKVRSNELRERISQFKARNCYLGIVVVGMASENYYSQMSILDHHYKKLFDAVSIPNNSPIKSLSTTLISEGFLYAIELQTISEKILNKFLTKVPPESSQSFVRKVVKRFCASRTLKSMVKYAGQLIKMVRLSKVVLPNSTMDRYKLEVQCFASAMWEKLLFHIDNKTYIPYFKEILFEDFKSSLEFLCNASELSHFMSQIGTEHLIMNDNINIAIIKTSHERGLICNDEFVNQASLLWDHISSRSSMLVMYGESGTGKSELLSVVSDALSKIGVFKHILFGDCWASKCVYSAYVIYRALKKWVFLSRKYAEIAQEEEKQAILDNDLIVSVPASPKSQKSQVSGTPSKSDKMDQQESDQWKQTNQITYLYHSSLNVEHFLGKFDGQGHWSDGIFLRYLRRIEKAILTNKKKNKNSSLSDLPINFLVLTGPIGYHLEQLLAATYFQNQNDNIPIKDQSDNHIILPTGEDFHIPANVKVIIETSDISNASPYFITNLSLFEVSVSSDIVIQRVLGAWIRSIINWLGDFPPWIDMMNELNDLFLKTKFIEDLIVEDYSSVDVPLFIVTSRLSGFLRYLEDLLATVHFMSIKTSTFVSPDENGSESDTESELDGESDILNKLNNRFAIKGVMTLGLKGRELLAIRTRISVIYAAIWGLGGSLNNSDKKKFFDNNLRDAIVHYFGDFDIDIAENCSVFECILDLENCCIRQAVYKDPKSKETVSNASISKKFENFFITSELIESNGFINLPSSGLSDKLMFHTPFTRAVNIAIKSLIGTGANILLVGPTGSGKTLIIKDILHQLKEKCPTPQEMRKQITDNLVDIVNGNKKSEGIFAALNILNDILTKLASTDSVEDTSSSSFESIWRKSNETLKALWSDNPAHHIRSKTITSSMTSVRGNSTASSLRSWFEREFASEVDDILETTRFSYGVAFIDDMNFLSEESISNSAQYIHSENLVESLIKGLVDRNSLFRIRKNVHVRSVMYMGVHNGSQDGGFEISEPNTPVLHKELLTDPRLLDATIVDNYIMQNIGLIGAATGSFERLTQSKRFAQNVSHFSCIGFPQMTVTELHISIVSGAILCMNSSVLDTQIVNLLKNEINELSKFTISMCTKMISSADASLTTGLERAIRSSVILDISMVSRFCLSLRYGSRNVSNPGGLIQLFAHEWKRFFLDPLPEGPQRERIVTLLVDQLNSIDEKAWSITTDWLKNLQNDFGAHKDKVWTNPNVFIEPFTHSKRLSMRLDMSLLSPRSSIDTLNKPVKTDIYLPVELERRGTEKSLLSGSWNSDRNAFNPVLSIDEICDENISKVIDLSNFKNHQDIDKIFYPAAITLLLRIIRIISVAGKNILLAGHFGSTRVSSVVLAAKLCNLSPLLFEVRESPNAVDTLSSESAADMSDFSLFFKSAVLKSAGLAVVFQKQLNEMDPNSFSSFHIECVDPIQVLVIIQNAHLLSVRDRKLLLNIIDLEDPGYLFSNKEIIEIAEALQKKAKYQLEELFFHEPQSTMRSQFSFSIDMNEDDTPMFSEGNQMNFLPEETSEAMDSKRKPIFSAYNYRFVIDYLVNKTRQNMKILLDTDVPRCMKLQSTYGLDKDKITATLKRVTGEGTARKTTKNSISLLSGATETKISASSNRFSILSSRKSMLLESSNVEKLSVYDPSDKKLLDDHSDTLGINGEAKNSGGGLTSDKSSSPDLDIGWGANKVNEYHGIFTCPYLGPILQRNFSIIWYDVVGEDAVKGICNIIMKNEPQRSIDKSFKKTYILSLKSSAVGSFVSPELLSNSLENESSSRGNIKLDNDLGSMGALSHQVRTKDQQGKEDQEKLRQTHFQSVTNNSKFNIVLKTNRNLELAFNKFSMISKLGVFKYHDNSIELDDEFLSSLDANLAPFIEEARNILPHILSIQTVSDSLFLSDQVINFGPELISERASKLVMQIIREGGLKLLKSKYILESAHGTFKKSYEVLNQLDALNKELEGNISDLQKISRNLSRDIDQGRKQMENIVSDSQKSPNFELEFMIHEEMLSLNYEAETLEDQIESMLKSTRKKIYSYGPIEWQGFSTNYSSKASKPFVELMRGIMVVINYTPPKALRAESSSGKLDDDLVSRCGSSLLIKSMEFASQICSVVPSSLSDSHLKALRIMNSLLNFNFAKELNHEDHCVQDRLNWLKRHSIMDPNSNQVFETIKYYLVLIEMGTSIHRYKLAQKEKVRALDSQFARYNQNNKADIQNKEKELKSILDTNLTHLHSIDSWLVEKRIKTDLIESLSIKKHLLQKALYESELFLVNEINNVKEILKFMVTDACIAATILFKSGWLPEQLKQESMEQIKMNLSQHNIKTSQSPFILGHLSENLQFSEWCELKEGGLPRDPASINGISLLYLVPFHALVIDPSGDAVDTLFKMNFSGYQNFLISAQKFSLKLLDSLLCEEDPMRDGIHEDKSSSSNEGIILFISDLQSGLSEDLIYFLSCDISVEMDSGHNEFVAFYSSNGGLASSIDSYDQSVVRIYKKIKVFLFSSYCPAYDSLGCCHPLPSACLKNVTLLHWPINIIQSHYVEAKPQTVLEESFHCSDMNLIYRFTESLSASLSPKSMKKMNIINQIEARDFYRLLKYEYSIIYSIYKWAIKHKNTLNKTLTIENLITQKNISLSVLEDDEISAILINSLDFRHDAIFQIEFNKNLLRDSLGYFYSLSDVFKMSADLVRFCGNFLPAEFFPPHMFTSKSLCENYLKPALFKDSIQPVLKKLPSSIYGAYKIDHGISLFQKAYRKLRSLGRSLKTTEESSQSSNQPTESSASKILHAALDKLHTDNSFMGFHDQIFLYSVSRKKALHALKVLLYPLREYFLSELMNHLIRSIRPGVEWVIKLSLLLTTWSKSSKLPYEEVRALLYFIHESNGVQHPRFTHYFPFNSESNFSKDIAKFFDQVNKHSRSISPSRSQSPMLRATSPSSRLSGGRPNSPQGSHLPNNSNQYKKSSPTNDSDKSFIAHLPGSGSLKFRKTAFKSIPQVSKADDSMTVRVNHSISHQFKETFGAIDGLFLNHNSSKWEIRGPKSRLPSNQFSFGSLLFNDADTIPTLSRTSNTLLSQISARYGDKFEVEWLKSIGVHNFSIIGNSALSSFGISEKSIEDLNHQRFTTLQKSPRLNQDPINPQRSSNISHHSVRASHSSKMSSLTTPKIVLASQKPNEEIIQRRKSTRRTNTAGTLSSSSVNDDNSNPLANESGRRQTKVRQPDSSAASNRPTRLSNALNDMTTGVGSHRHSLLHTKSILSSQSFIKKRDSRVSTFSSSKNSSSDYRFNANGGVIDDLFDLVVDPHGLRNVLLLESHPSLLPTFKGLTAGINRNINEFVDWKQSILRLTSIDPFKLSDSDLEYVLHSIIPPVVAEAHEIQDHSVVKESGIWAKGFQLSILQTFLLSEALIPGSCGSLVEVYFSLLSHYLKNDGHIITHPDEVEEEDDEEEDDHDEDDDDDEEEGSFGIGEEDQEDENEYAQSRNNSPTSLSLEGNNNDNEPDENTDENDTRESQDSFDERSLRSTTASRIASSMIFSVQEEDEGAGEDEDAYEGKEVNPGHPDQKKVLQSGNASNEVVSIDKMLKASRTKKSRLKTSKGPRSTFMQMLTSFNNSNKTLAQSDLDFINSWSKLEKILTGKSNYKHSYLPSSYSNYQLSCRDYENWEAVLLSAITQPIPIEKFIFMKELRDTTYGDNSHIFLANKMSSNQIAILSQRGRDLSIQNNHPLPIYNLNYMLFSSPNKDSYSIKPTKASIHESIKAIKSSIQSARSRGVILEHIDLHSTASNSVLNSVISLSQSSFVKKEPSNEKSTPTELFESLVDTNATTKRELLAQKQKQQKRNHSLVISSEWGGNGRGSYLFGMDSRLPAFGPFFEFGALSFMWLPRYISPDIIQGANDLGNESEYSYGLPPSINESCGVLYEELESSLLWVIINSRNLEKTKLTLELKKKIKLATKLEIRITASLITIWQLLSYFKNKKKEDSGEHAVWSACLNPMSLWQLVRLMLKISDLLKFDWQFESSTELLRQEKFCKAIWLICESFSGMESNIYEASYHSSGDKIDPMADKYKKIRETFEKNSLVYKKLSLHQKMGNPSQNNSGGPASSLVSPRPPSQILSLPKPQVPLLKPNIRKTNLTRTSQLGKKNASNTTPMSLRAKKMMKKAEKQLNQNRLKYIQSLSTPELLSTYFSSSNVSQQDFDVIDTFNSLTALFLADIQKLYNVFNANSSQENDKKGLNFYDVAQELKNNRRMSNKLNIKSFLSSNVAKVNEFESWPPISENVNLSFGSLSAKDIVQCMVKWTLDGKTASINPKINRQRILNSIKNLSLKIKKGEFALPAQT